MIVYQDFQLVLFILLWDWYRNWWDTQVIQSCALLFQYCVVTDSLILYTDMLATGDDQEWTRLELACMWIYSFSLGALEPMCTKFIYLIASVPVVRTLIPFSASDITKKGDEAFQLMSDFWEYKVEHSKIDAAE